MDGLGLAVLAWLWGVLLVLFTVPAGVFVVQVLLASGGARGRRPAPAGERRIDAAVSTPPRVAVLIPAHNEAQGIVGTLAGLASAHGEAFRVVVVADNCSDDTAALARQSGVEVLERTHDTLRGKGHALQFGLDHIRRSPPSVLVVVDADCQVSATDLTQLALETTLRQTPVQCKNLMVAPPGAPVSVKVAAFAWLVKTWVRPTGWGRLGAPCQLMGTGMAFPWSIIGQQNLASGHIVEDLQLTMALAAQGTMASFYPDVGVISLFPVNAHAVQVQRSRWEHGHLGMLKDELPGLLALAWRRRDARVLALALDIAVPPLSLLVLALLMLAALALLFSAWTGWWWMAGWAMGLLGLSAGAVMLAWWQWGRGVISGAELLGVPRYVWSKLGIYKRFVQQRERVWKRTDRD